MEYLFANAAGLQFAYTVVLPCICSSGTGEQSKKTTKSTKKNIELKETVGKSIGQRIG